MASKENRREKRWTEEDMKRALDEVESERMTQYKAAQAFNIPRQTLNDRVKNKVRSRTIGRPCRLSREEEKEIVESCVIFSEWGYGIGKKEVMGLVADYCKANNKKHLFPANGIPGKRWWNGFLKRNPEVSMRRPQSLQISRARATTPEIIDHWFYNVLKPLLEKTGTINHPERIYNADETSFNLCGRPQRVVSKKGAKSPQYVVGGTGKENITLQGCISGDGKLLPPYILYTGQRLMSDYTEGGPLGTRYSVSEKGWMTEINFLDWLKMSFIPSLPDERPVVLIIDGHKSHIQYNVLKLASDNGIEIAKLPAHTTHVLQPLDLGVFKPLKEAYDREAHAFFLSNRRYITKRNFPSLITKAWKSFKPSSAKNAFRKAGIIPFSREAVSIDSLAPSVPFHTSTSSSSNSTVPSPVLDDNVPSSSTAPSLTDNVPSSSTAPSLTDLLGDDIQEITEILTPIMSPLSPQDHLPEYHTTVLPEENHDERSSPLSTPHSTNGNTPSSIPSTSTTTPALREYFTEFLRTQTPPMKTSRNRSIASLGESLTAEDALQRQKNIEDEKKRKEAEKEERKRIRLEKREQKRMEQELKGMKKRKGQEIQIRKSDRSKKSRRRKC